MKIRIISAIVILAILSPIFIQGGMLFNLTMWIIGLLGLKEFLDIRGSKKALPEFMKLISYILFTLITLVNMTNQELIFSIDFRVITGLFISMLLPVTLYHDSKKYSINDAFYLIGGIFFLGVSFNLLIVLRNIELNLLLYLFTITIMTDTYAYIGGLLVGKHPLLTSISPKKTIEGMLLGTLFGTFIACVFYHIVVNPNLSLMVVIVMTLFLSILGQFGDLAFSAIKRYFGKKDFSNMIPGHGGILDRLDSIIFVVLGFIFFIAII